ncbi:peptidoglycan-binding domain-containing protein, partial [Hydrogenibacillus schlegelii]|uniref:peptidoglycan-binding domain-containing protein n=1 Tax=Hydrogenibacillus schlegelii TaxID=1484 RepID=UPI003F606A51
MFELQGRLKYLVFYTGPVEGVFGWRTYLAVRNFQYRFGLRVDAPSARRPRPSVMRRPRAGGRRRGRERG